MSADGSFFEVARDAGVAHLQLNRPERLNTMTPEFFTALHRTVEELDTKGDTRALVISSTGKHFSAGMSFDVFGDDGHAAQVGSARARLQFRRTLTKLMSALTVLEQVRFPVVCAVQGGCIGGGLDLATACDIRLCSRDAFFVVQEISIGMAADLGVLQRLPKIVSPGVARQMAYTGERVGAERALDVGLVNEVLESHPAVLDRALELAGSIAAKSPLAIAGTKVAINYGLDHSVDASLRRMALLQSAIYDAADMEHAIDGWKSKLPATFDSLL